MFKSTARASQTVWIWGGRATWHQMLAQQAICRKRGQPEARPARGRAAQGIYRPKRSCRLKQAERRERRPLDCGRDSSRDLGLERGGEGSLRHLRYADLYGTAMASRRSRYALLRHDLSGAVPGLRAECRRLQRCSASPTRSVKGTRLVVHGRATTTCTTRTEALSTRWWRLQAVHEMAYPIGSRDLGGRNDASRVSVDAYLRRRSAGAR